MKFIVMSGGCYGSQYVRFLKKAHQKGKLLGPPEIVVVDRNETPRARREHGEAGVRYVRAELAAFFYEALADPAPWADAHIVPWCLGPNVFGAWIARSLAAQGPAPLKVTPAPSPYAFGLPFERVGRDGALFISAADWICPVNCTEPAICPAIRAPRTWELADILREKIDPGIDALAVLTCKHLTHGVGTTPVRQLLDARAQILDLARKKPDFRFTLGTVSGCHGVVSTFRVRAARSPSPLPG